MFSTKRTFHFFVKDKSSTATSDNIILSPANMAKSLKLPTIFPSCVLEKINGNLLKIPLKTLATWNKPATTIDNKKPPNAYIAIFSFWKKTEARKKDIAKIKTDINVPISKPFPQKETVKLEEKTDATNTERTIAITPKKIRFLGTMILPSTSLDKSQNNKEIKIPKNRKNPLLTPKEKESPGIKKIGKRKTVVKKEYKDIFSIMFIFCICDFAKSYCAMVCWSAIVF